MKNGTFLQANHIQTIAIFGGRIRRTAKGAKIGKRFVPSSQFEGTVIQHGRTDEMLSLASILDRGERFDEFDAMKLFQTTKPAGTAIQAWFTELWISDAPNKFTAAAWIKSCVPLDVLLGCTVPQPGVTTGQNNWHWSSDMATAKNPKIG